MKSQKGLKGAAPPTPLLARKQANTRLPPLRGLNRRPRNAPLFRIFLWGNSFPHTPCDTAYRLWKDDTTPPCLNNSSHGWVSSKTVAYKGRPLGSAPLYRRVLLVLANPDTEVGAEASRHGRRVDSEKARGARQGGRSRYNAPLATNIDRK